MEFFTEDESDPLELETLQQRTVAESVASSLRTAPETEDLIQTPQHSTTATPGSNS